MCNYLININIFQTNLMAESFGCLTASLAAWRRRGRSHLARSAWLSTADRWLSPLHSWYLQSPFYFVPTKFHMAFMGRVTTTMLGMIDQ